MIKLNKKVENRFRIDSKKFNKLVKIKYRPILSNVHYSEEGHIEYTNTIIAIRLLNVYEGKELFKHGLPIDDGTYPDLGKIFKNYEDLEHVKLPTKEIEDLIHPFIALKTYQIKMIINEDNIKIQVDDENNIQNNSNGLININTNIKEPFEIYLNPNYLYHGLRFFRLLGINEVSFYYDKSLRPIFLKNENLEMVIMPQRKV